ncbi:MAG: hypothetical protein DRP13_00985, partial [Candidatus Aenigmatarchaeota archaeon]
YGVNTDGKQVFSFAMNDYGSNSILAENGIIYIPSRDNHLYAVKTNGEILWKFKAANAVEAPTFHKGVIYFGSCDCNLYAVDAFSGNLIWKFSSGNILVSTPVVCNGVIYMGGWDCNFYALSASDGRVVWKFRTSISTVSKFDMELMRPQRQFKTIWISEEEEKPEEKKEERELSDYGKIESDYTAGLSKDYIKGKKGYL